MQLKQAIKDAGGTSVVAARLGVTPQCLSNWVDRGVPPTKCAEVERVLKPRVTRADLRPEDWAVIWPELAEAKAA
ncbi:hypothetical protein C7T35_15310 [Variovorax sp. WS11]|uniref:transcriptional regulator n=1 Tax=Variovorax sp. WS11 TaxID=1105204 RepID=UPI000D0CE858|nr:helix-turn-helix domain-containing protein [Variovorax sp. WS11]PSL83749.1 hypothetical protein C7T35_15310 [Variovorax sp. WS11]